MAIQILLSSMSLNVGLHFCGDQIKSFSFFSPAEKCSHAEGGMKHQGMKDCPFHKKEKKNCCDDVELTTEAQDQSTTLSKLEFELTAQVKLLAAFFLSYARPLFTTELYAHKFHNYKPPLLSVNIPVLIQTFLI